MVNITSGRATDHPHLQWGAESGLTGPVRAYWSCGSPGSFIVGYSDLCATFDLIALRERPGRLRIDKEVR